MASHRTWPSLPTAHCEKCGDPTPEAKYHDCGEQLELFDLEQFRKEDR